MTIDKWKSLCGRLEDLCVYTNRWFGYYNLSVVLNSLELHLYLVSYHSNLIACFLCFVKGGLNTASLWKKMACRL